MAVDVKIERIVRLFPDDCQPHSMAPFTSAESFSGARLWRLNSARGPLCLRRWPAEYPTQTQLEFIQATLWHVDQEGFHRIPLPLETRHHHGFVRHDGHLWELTPWLPGAADYRQRPTPAKLRNALLTLAKFHQAAATFPAPETGPTASPGLVQRLARLESLLSGGLVELRSAIDPGPWPELSARGNHLIALAAKTAPRFLSRLKSAARLCVTLQPCIRDIWHAHVLYVGDEVSGLVDFGSMRPENVAGDVARLLGSLAGDNQNDWQRGLAAYATVRPLSSDELALVAVFDRSTVLMGGLQWLDWIYLQGRTFSHHGAVLARLDEFLSRFENLSQTVEQE
jgi:Ser/Thr protein kinase RdoA (MazF antagonist)